MKLRWDKWLYGLGSMVIGGGAGAVVAGGSNCLIAPAQFNVTSWAGVLRVLSSMAINFVLTGILTGFFYLKQSPLPPPADDSNPRAFVNPNPPEPPKPNP